MRIAAKELRYTLEAFEDALEPGATLISEVTALQDAAGEMHDAIVAADRARSTIDAGHRRREQLAVSAFARSQDRRASPDGPSSPGASRASEAGPSASRSAGRSPEWATFRPPPHADPVEHASASRTNHS